MLPSVVKRSLKHTFFHMIEKKKSCQIFSDVADPRVYWTAKHMDLRRGVFQLWHEADETGSRPLTKAFGISSISLDCCPDPLSLVRMACLSPHVVHMLLWLQYKIKHFI